MKTCRSVSSHKFPQEIWFVWGLMFSDILLGVKIHLLLSIHMDTLSKLRAYRFFAITNFIVFGLNRLGIEHMVFRSRSKHASNYTTIEHMVFRSRSKHASNYTTIEHIQPDLMFKSCYNTRWNSSIDGIQIKIQFLDATKFQRKHLKQSSY